MSFFCRLSRRHYWCTPHRSADNRLVQVCYECGAERPAREFHNEVSAEWHRRSIASAKDELAKISSQSLPEIAPHSENQKAVAVGQDRARKFVLVK